jgi:hypothetical protein
MVWNESCKAADGKSYLTRIAGRDIALSGAVDDARGQRFDLQPLCGGKINDAVWGANIVDLSKVPVPCSALSFWSSTLSVLIPCSTKSPSMPLGLSFTTGTVSHYLSS